MSLQEIYLVKKSNSWDIQICQIVEGVSLREIQVMGIK